MAEIRSTLDMVMERAARMAAEANLESSQEDTLKKGMRLAANHLTNIGEESLLATLQQQKKDDQPAIKKGMIETLLRNIVLPRDEALHESGMKALAAIAQLSGKEVTTICDELLQILNQYSQHKDQMQQQLEDAIRSQLEQKLAQQGAKVSDSMSINPAMHPQYREELARMLSDLNRQYNQALEQRREMIRQRLNPSK